MVTWWPQIWTFSVSGGLSLELPIKVDLRTRLCNRRSGGEILIFTQFISAPLRSDGIIYALIRTKRSKHLILAFSHWIALTPCFQGLLFLLEIRWNFNLDTVISLDFTQQFPKGSILFGILGIFLFINLEGSYLKLGTVWNSLRFSAQKNPNFSFRIFKIKNCFQRVFWWHSYLNGIGTWIWDLFSVGLIFIRTGFL